MASPGTTIITCPVCHDTSPLRAIYQFPCSHHICAGCLEQLPAEGDAPSSDVRCPLCREVHGRGEVQPHQGLLMLSAAHHCSGCRHRWDDADHMPMVLRPCLHQVCRACAAQEHLPCPICHADTTGKSEDSAFWAALATGRLALPPWEVLQDPHQQRQTSVYRLRGDLELCIDAFSAMCAWLLRNPDATGETWRSSPLRPRTEWPTDKKERFNQICGLAVEVGQQLPLLGSINALTIRDALGFTGELADIIYIEMDHAVQTRKARMSLPARAQRAVHPLGVQPSVVL